MRGAPTPLALIGLGSVGRRLALGWQRAGLRVAGHSPSSASRERARAEGLRVEDELAPALRGARCLVLCVGDVSLEQAATDVARALDPGQAPICLHTCGHRGVSALAPLAARGCPTGTFHPLAAFASEGPGPALAEAWCAIGGDASARAAASELARALGARTFALREGEDAALRYHTAAALLANGTVALTSIAMDLAREACSEPGAARDAFLALLKSTLANLERAAPERALTGPVSRGDAATVRAHLAGLANDPAASELYRQLSRRMLELARRDGRIDAEALRALQGLLSR